ncbi:hypothetical protein HK405_008097, partial [Cladochytrium tenue]
MDSHGTQYAVYLLADPNTAASDSALSPAVSTALAQGGSASILASSSTSITPSPSSTASSASSTVFSSMSIAAAMTLTTSTSTAASTDGMSGPYSSSTATMSPVTSAGSSVPVVPLVSGILAGIIAVAVAIVAIVLLRRRNRRSSQKLYPAAGATRNWPGGRPPLRRPTSSELLLVDAKSDLGSGDTFKQRGVPDDLGYYNYAGDGGGYDDDDDDDANDPFSKAGNVISFAPIPLPPGARRPDTAQSRHAAAGSFSDRSSPLVTTPPPALTASNSLSTALLYSALIPTYPTTGPAGVARNNRHSDSDTPSPPSFDRSLDPSPPDDDEEYDYDADMHAGGGGRRRRRRRSSILADPPIARRPPTAASTVVSYASLPVSVAASWDWSSQPSPSSPDGGPSALMSPSPTATTTADRQTATSASASRRLSPLSPPPPSAGSATTSSAAADSLDRPPRAGPRAAEAAAAGIARRPLSPAS